MSEEIIYGHITRTPGVCGGKPRIAGHRITVQHIAIDYQWDGMSPEEICEQHPGLTLGKVHAALAYFFDHRDEILVDIEADEKLEAEFLRQHPDGVQRG
jgi:uncharacterized protein (DUF433 family)